MLQAEVITDLGQLKNLKPEWNKLLEHSHTNSIFLTWEWVYSWWVVFGTSSELFIVTVKDESGKIVGIAPLCIRKSIYYRFPVREMIFIGMGHADRQDFILSDNSGQTINKIISAIHDSQSRWDIVNLEQVPQDSFWLSDTDIAANYRFQSENSSSCPYVQVNGSWETYYKGLSKKFKRDIKHKTNRLTRSGNWELEFNNTAITIEDLIISMKNIELESRKNHTEKAFLSIEKNREFLIKFCTCCLQNQWLDCATITMNGESIAFLLGFVYANKYHAYNMVFSEQFYQSSPGKLLLNEKIKWCFDQNNSVQEFDFLRGAFYIKSLWTTEKRQHLRCLFFKNTLYSRLLEFLVFGIRPRIKSVLNS